MKTYNYTTSQFNKMKECLEFFNEGDILRVTNLLYNKVEVYEVKIQKVLVAKKEK